LPESACGVYDVIPSMINSSREAEYRRSLTAQAVAKAAKPLPSPAAKPEGPDAATARSYVEVEIPFK
jgi:hypothetical protein